MKIRYKNKWYNTEEVIEGKSLDSVKRDIYNTFKVKAREMTIDEVENNWEECYSSFKEALDATYENLLSQFKSEAEFSIVEE